MRGTQLSRPRMIFKSSHQTEASHYSLENEWIVCGSLLLVDRTPRSDLSPLLRERQRPIMMKRKKELGQGWLILPFPPPLDPSLPRSRIPVNRAGTADYPPQVK